MRLVGFMRNRKKPSELAKLTAMLSKSQDITLLYMTPEGINMETGTVDGLVYEDNKWKTLSTTLPPIVDLNQPCFKPKNKAIINYLRENTHLTYDMKNPLNKHQLMEELAKDEKFAHISIPSLKVSNIGNVIDFITRYETVVLKPIHSERGRGVYILKKSGENYILGYRTDERLLSIDDLNKFLEEKIINRSYILQKYISSKTKNGDPFDCRIYVQKDGNGEWKLVKHYIRIGIGQKVISNVNQGGGISDAIPFLKANFIDEWEDINKRLKYLAKTLPYKIEELKGAQSMTIGFDVAIDQDGEIYLFESNGAPAAQPVLAKTSLLRVDYYRYLLKQNENEIQESNGHKIYSAKQVEALKKEYLKKIENLEREILEIKDVNKYLTKKLKAYENSRSWKLTKPLRSFKERFKR